MTLITAAAIGIIFGCGSYLVLKPDLFRVIVGLVMISNAANLALISSGLTRGDAPILPFRGEVSDPLVQAMTLTAIVIGFAVAALLLGLARSVHRTHETVDLDDLSWQEARTEAELEREELSI